ncbi:hypothetical protein KW801_02385 [Candidatus Saccharibacteria bacterium]|nr:hypothetical protein [Candidatus Saccharibacteria bacterium]
MYNFIGIIGGLLILLGFYRISIGKWTGKSFWYEFDNLFGALFILIYQLHYKVYISAVLNIIWAVVAFRGIVSYRERRKE